MLRQGLSEYLVLEVARIYFKERRLPVSYFPLVALVGAEGGGARAGMPSLLTHLGEARCSGACGGARGWDEGFMLPAFPRASPSDGLPANPSLSFSLFCKSWNDDTAFGSRIV